MKKHTQLCLFTASWFVMSITFFQQVAADTGPILSRPVNMIALDFVVLRLMPAVLLTFSGTNFLLSAIKLYAWMSDPENRKSIQSS